MDFTRRRAGYNPLLAGFQLAQQALVNLDGDTLVKSGSSVVEFPNQGTGGADYDLDVAVGTGANLRESISDAALLYGASGDYISTPDSAAFPTGDIEQIWHGTLNVYGGPDQNLTSKMQTDGQSSCRFFLNTSDILAFQYTPDGSFASIVTGTSIVATDVPDGTDIYFKFTYNSTTGKLNFYKSSDGESYTSVGVEQTIAAGNIFDGADALQLGQTVGAAGNPAGSIYQVQIYNGIGGTLAADFNAADYVNRSSDTQFPSSTTGEIYTLNGNTFIQNTGHSVIHSIGSAGLESTAGQLISGKITAFCVHRAVLTGGVSFRVFDARSDNTKRVLLFGSAGSPPVLSGFQGSTVAVDDYTTEATVFTGQYNQDSTSKFTGSGIGTATGDAGNQDWDYASLFTGFDGASSLVGYIAKLVVFDRELNESEIAAMQAYLTSLYAL